MATSTPTGLRVLFVDDEKSLQEFMRAELPRLGHEVTVCPDGKAAVGLPTILTVFGAGCDGELLPAEVAARHDEVTAAGGDLGDLELTEPMLDRLDAEHAETAAIGGHGRVKADFHGKIGDIIGPNLFREHGCHRITSSRMRKNSTWGWCRKCAKKAKQGYSRNSSNCPAIVGLA